MNNVLEPNESKSIDCRVCGTTVVPFFDLGKMPLVNSFLKKEDKTQEKKYPLVVAFCPQCYLVQLVETTPPEVLFGDYIYFSSTSTSFLEHCKRTAEYFISRLELTTQSLVLEIASNDGAQLQYFREFGVKILGIDPAKNVAAVANERGLKTIPKFFNYELAKKLNHEDEITADLVYGANVLAHVPEIVDFVRGVSEVLKSQGTAIFEFPYVNGLMENKFDTIYHEHVFYYSLIALKNLFAKANLEIYDVEMIPVQGGSLRIFAAHAGTVPIRQSIKELTQQELKQNFDTIKPYQQIRKNVDALRSELLTLLNKLKSQGKKIVGYSAPAKGNILLNYFGINQDFLNFIVEKSPHKQGLYAPGTHLPVYPLSRIYENKVDYLLILCWNIYEEVIAMEELKAFRKAGGKFIVPIPSIKIL